MIIARGAFEIRVGFLVGTRRRTRRTREIVRRSETAPSLHTGPEVWPPAIEIGPAFIAERVAVAHALRRAEMQVTLRRLLGVLGLRTTH
jgi:hypothetical protein